MPVTPDIAGSFFSRVSHPPAFFDLLSFSFLFLVLITHGVFRGPHCLGLLVLPRKTMKCPSGRDSFARPLLLTPFEHLPSWHTLLNPGRCSFFFFFYFSLQPPILFLATVCSGPLVLCSSPDPPKRFFVVVVCQSFLCSTGIAGFADLFICGLRTGGFFFVLSPTVAWFLSFFFFGVFWCPSGLSSFVPRFRGPAGCWDERKVWRAETFPVPRLLTFFPSLCPCPPSRLSERPSLVCLIRNSV